MIVPLCVKLQPEGQNKAGVEEKAAVSFQPAWSGQFFRPASAMVEGGKSVAPRDANATRVQAWLYTSPEGVLGRACLWSDGNVEFEAFHPPGPTHTLRAGTADVQDVEQWLATRGYKVSRVLWPDASP